MNDPRRDHEGHRESTLADVIDLAGRRIMSGLIAGGLLIGLGLWAQSSPESPTYQMVATDKGIARLNVRNGYVTTCEEGRCLRTLRPGSRDIERDEDGDEVREVPAPAAQPRLNPPAATPAQQQQATPAPAGGNAQ